MPVKSYLVIPKAGQKDQLKSSLEAIPQCEVSLSENRNLLVLLTETLDEASDKILFERLLSNPFLDHINLVSAFAT